jgi:hypothetical protein
MGASRGITGMRTPEERHAMSARIPQTQYEQLQDIAAWYGCSLNEALVHCINSHSISLFQSLNENVSFT